MAHMMPPGPHMVPPDHLIPQHDPAAMMHLNAVNPELVHTIIQQIKINGIFDEMRKECVADIDTKPAFLNLKQRVESHVRGILSNQQWSPSLNKNQLRSRIRESVMQSGILNEGVNRILHQVFSVKAQAVFLPKVRDFVKDKGQDIMKELMPPPPMDIPPPINVNPQQFGLPPPMPGPVEMVEPFHQPPIPVQPPPPEAPMKTSEGGSPRESVEASQSEELGVEMSETTEEILTYGDQEFYVKDIARDDTSMVTDDSIVKAIKTPSPERSDPETEETPKIPEDAVNPLRNLIQSLLVSKQTLDTTEDGVEVEGEVGVEDFSPTIDVSLIESFTDDENDIEMQHEPSHEAYSPKPLSPSKHAPSDHSSPDSQTNEPYSPPNTYSPQSPDYEPSETSKEATSHAPETGHTPEIYHEEGTTLPYDPSKFSYERMSDSASIVEGSSSAPSPVEAAEPQAAKDAEESPEEGCLSPESENASVRVENLERESRAVERGIESSDSSTSSSGGSLESSSEDDAAEGSSPLRESVEETVEEIEVVEEFITASGDEENVQSESDKSEEKMEKIIPKAYQEKAKKKKTKKKKLKKTKSHKRARSSSISSGEITSSDSDSSNASPIGTRPPLAPNRDNEMILGDHDERRRVHRSESIPDGPFWRNTGSSSDYMSSPRMHRPLSPPPRRPYSPDFRRFEDGRARDMGYLPPPGPHFRDRPVYRGDFSRSRARFSPPYRRSPPHRYSPGPRMDYPRMPFSSPRSPHRRPYSPPPPHIYHGEPRPFPPPRHRWPSPPRPGAVHRMPSRSPPPGMRRDEGPSRY